MTDKMREEFEKWHMERYGGFGLGRSTEPGYTDEYERVGTNLQWAAWQAAQSVPVVGEPVGWVSTIECIGPDYKKNLFGRLPIQSLQAGYYSHTALYEKPTHSIPAAELASLREKAAMADALRKDAERYRWLRDGEKSAGTGMTDEAIDAHIAKERQS